jgi:hypothetical protein
MPGLTPLRFGVKMQRVHKSILARLACVRRLLLPILLTVGIGMLVSACTYTTAVPSVQGKAFVVQRAWFFKSSLWHCDSTGQQPICFETAKR